MDVLRMGYHLTLNSPYRILASKPPATAGNSLLAKSSTTTAIKPKLKQGGDQTHSIMENNTIISVSKADRAAKIKEMETAGFGALRSGLGVPAGKYKFTTPNNEAIYALKPITAGSGQKYGLTLVAGTLIGQEDVNKSVNNVYGLTATDKQFVVTVDQFNAIEPNQTYDIVINEKSRIQSLALASVEVLAEA